MRMQKNNRRCRRGAGLQMKPIDLRGMDMRKLEQTHRRHLMELVYLSNQMEHKFNFTKADVYEKAEYNTYLWHFQTGYNFESAFAACCKSDEKWMACYFQEELYQWATK